MPDDFHSPDSAAPPPALLRLEEQDRARLAEALQELLAHGSILGMDAGQGPLYAWCRQHFAWLKETADLAGFEVVLLHEERMVQAIPRVGRITLRLRKDATLVWLALWYAADVRWRDEGETQAFLSVAELNALLRDQLLPDTAGHFAPGRLTEILRQAARYNLIRFSPAQPPEESGIEVLPAIRRIVPFRDLAEWTESAQSFTPGSALPGTAGSGGLSAEPGMETEEEDRES